MTKDTRNVSVQCSSK